MDSKPSGLGFAVIGHQEKWSSALSYINSLREKNGTNLLSLEQVKDVYHFIPPRDIFHINTNSSKGNDRKGAYVETFISPDHLDIHHLRPNMKKIEEACEYVAALNIPVVTLGGFTSIILEATNTKLSRIKNSFFTTGNTLTAAFIAEGVKQACDFQNLNLSESSLLIVGATGDIGSACVQYFSGRVKELLLCARREAPLKKLADEFSTNGFVKYSANVNELLPKADIMICVASSILGNCNLNLLPAHAIICDAGYPKNIDAMNCNRKIFWGGMGWMKGGYEFEPDCKNQFYSFALPDISHGCNLEGVVLAMENLHTSFSIGRGNITVESMEKILNCAMSNGIVTAPLFNATSGWDENLNSTNGKYFTGTGIAV